MAIQPQHAAAVPAGIRIFGREPALLLGLVEAFIAMLVVIIGPKTGLDETFVVVVMAVISGGIGLYSAIATRDALLGVSLGLLKAIFGLTAYFGFDLDLETQAALVSFLAATIGFLQRTQTSPVAAPVSPSPTQVIVSREWPAAN